MILLQDQIIVLDNGKVGDKVIHRAFGIGEIIEESSDTSYKVRFDKGDRFIQSDYLRKIDTNNSTDCIAFSHQEEQAVRVPTSNDTEAGFDILSLDQIRKGSIVEHKRFGKGSIIRINESSTAPSLEIEFDNHETRRILLKFAKLRVIKY